jgi:hypothetical protein
VPFSKDLKFFIFYLEFLIIYFFNFCLFRNIRHPLLGDGANRGCHLRGGFPTFQFV